MNTPISCDTLVTARMVLTQDAERRIIENGAVAITCGRIAGVGAADEFSAAFRAEQTIGLGNALLLPGLINSHTHAPMSLLRGIGDDQPLMTWLTEYMWPLEFRLEPEHLELGALLNCAEMLRTGTTSLVNGYMREERTGAAVDQAGMRAVLGEGYFDFPSPMFADKAAYREAFIALHERFADHPRITAAVMPHAVFTVSPDNLRAGYELACELDVPLQVHAAESPADTAQCVEKWGARPLRILQENGLLNERSILHHCVDLLDEEIELLAQSGVHVVHVPVSNWKLVSGLARVDDMLAAGIRPGLGTDGAASNNQQNLFRDMGAAALVGKIQADDASALPAQAVLDMATRNGAAIMGAGGLGRIEPGSPADLCALDLGSPNLNPMNDPVSHVVYAASGHEVFWTMCDGRVLYERGVWRTIDMPALLAEIDDLARWLRS